MLLYQERIMNISGVLNTATKIEADGQAAFDGVKEGSSQVEVMKAQQKLSEMQNIMSALSSMLKIDADTKSHIIQNFHVG
jgi:hypothetical protein